MFASKVSVCLSVFFLSKRRAIRKCHQQMHQRHSTAFNPRSDCSVRRNTSFENSNAINRCTNDKLFLPPRLFPAGVSINVTKVRMKIRTLVSLVLILFKKANLETLSRSTSYLSVRNLKTVISPEYENVDIARLHAPLEEIKRRKNLIPRRYDPEKGKNFNENTANLIMYQ